MARVINAEDATFIGTSKQIAEFLGLLRGNGAAVVNLDRSNFVLLGKPLSKDSVRAAIEATPKK
jgi:hypothetical protein